MERWLPIEKLKFGGNIKAWTLFAPFFFCYLVIFVLVRTTVSVSEDFNLWIFLFNLLDEGVHGGALLARAGVLGVAVPGEASDVADAKADGVMAGAVGAHFALGAADMDAAVTINDEVVADLTEASGAMPAVDVLDCVVFAFGGGTAMDDDFGDFSHR